MSRERVTAACVLEELAAMALEKEPKTKLRSVIDVLGRADAEIVRLEALVKSTKEALREEAEAQAQIATQQLAASFARAGELMAKAEATKLEADSIRERALSEAYTARRAAVEEIRDLRAYLAAESEQTRRERELVRTLRATIGRGRARADGYAGSGQLSMLEGAPASVPEPPPEPRGEPVIPGLLAWLREQGEEAAAQLVVERDAFGTRKYGQTLLSDDGRDPIEDCRQELGDALIYSWKARMRGADGSSLFSLARVLRDLLEAL